jgi:hypothetical protein
MALDVFFDTPRALCVVTKFPIVIDNLLPGVYPQHAPPHNAEQPGPGYDSRQSCVQLGDRAVHYGNGQSGLIAAPCKGRLNPPTQSGRRSSRT